MTDYFSIPAASYSRLKVLYDDPFEYWAAFENTPAIVAVKDSEALDRGHIAHAALLEPHRVNELYAVYPEGMLSGDYQSVSSKEAKKFKKDARARGVIPVKQKDLDQVNRMVKGLLANDVADLLEQPAHLEETITWQETVVWERGETVIDCKAKLDIRLHEMPHLDHDIILDLKFPNDASAEGFARSCGMWLYHLQDATYRRAAEIKTGRPARLYFVAVQDHPAGVRVGVHEIAPGSDEQRHGDALRQHLLRDLARRRATNDWRCDWESKINPVRLKPWDMRLAEV